MKSKIDHVNVSLIVELTSNTHTNHYFFTEEWNFQIDKFSFSKRNDYELDVCFSFDAVLTRYDDKNNVTLQETPSVYARKFQGEENHLEILLDLISLVVGHGLRIKPDSYLFTCSTSQDIPIDNNNPIDKPNTRATEKQYKNIIKNTGDKKGLIAALRVYRASLWNEDPNHRVPKLYAALEQIYGQGAGGKMLSRDEVRKISKFLRSIDITGKRMDVVLSQISRIPSKSQNEMLIEKIGLMSSDGDVTADEKKEMFAFWRKARSIPAHGSILPKRGFSIQTLLHELESIVEALIYGEVKPKMICYIVFKEGSLNPEFVNRKGKLIGHTDDYSYFAVRNDEVKIYLQNIGNEIIKAEESVFIISFEKIDQISKNDGIRKVEISALQPKLAMLIKKINKRIS